jgi:hypothetical protein
MSWVVTSSQLNQVNTPIANNEISPVPPSFEVSWTPSLDSSICRIPPIEMSWVLTSSELNQVNTPIGNNQISPVPPSFEVSRTPLVDSSICRTPTIEMSWVVISSQLNQANTPGFRVSGYMGVPTKIAFFFWALRWPTPPFMRVLKPMVQ